MGAEAKIYNDKDDDDNEKDDTQVPQCGSRIAQQNKLDEKNAKQEAQLILW